MEGLTIRISGQVLRVAALIFAVIVLASVFFYFWSSNVFASKYILHAYLPDAAGLSLRSPVRLDGLRVGSVIAIRPVAQSGVPERSIEVVLQVDKRFQDAIRSDSMATVVSEGLLGNRDINVHRGFQGNAIGANGEIQFVSTQEMTLKDVVDSLKRAADCSQAERNSVLKTQVLPPAR
jgi:phospholipid/cholesterol/gamma-HCH transport system substrate-binding protein